MYTGYTVTWTKEGKNVEHPSYNTVLVYCHFILCIFISDNNTYYINKRDNLQVPQLEFYFIAATPPTKKDVPELNKCEVKHYRNMAKTWKQKPNRRLSAAVKRLKKAKCMKPKCSKSSINLTMENVTITV